MGNPLSAQALLLAATLLTGLGLGALYDLFRVLRERSGAAAGVMLDLIYCLAFALALFALGMGPARGEARGYMPPLALGGAGIWFLLFGRAARRAFRALRHGAGRALALAAAPLRRAVKALQSLEKKIKTLFSFWTKRFRIALVSQTKQRGDRRDRDEADAFQFLYDDCDRGAGGLCGGHAGNSPRQHRRGGG